MSQINPTESGFELFHPLVAKWFAEHVGIPTDVQRRAWPVIADGGHVLVTAPTGSGKTLTAFLWALNRFITGHAGEIPDRRVLYISPLKALNNDIERNLQAPLAGLREFFYTRGEDFPAIHIAVRSGDTAPDERRRMLKHPPEIFITTPESLNVLLASKGGHRLLSGIDTVILDEIHAVATSKRGVYLMSAIERLADLNGEFQRIVLSATVSPLDTIADFAGGYEAIVHDGMWEYRKRDIRIIQSDVEKQYEITVDGPSMVSETSTGAKDEWWQALTDMWSDIISRNTSTLLFANSRRMVEKVTRLINEKLEEDRVYSHHGSLSKDIRAVVEQRLKQGELAGIVATSSLELGIDIGAVDEVVLVQAPYAVSSAIQRIGRAGHGVGRTSRATFTPIHAREFIDAAVISPLVSARGIEDVAPVENPLDVLAQILLAECLDEARNIDELYGLVRSCWSFRNLPRREFDLVIEMLAGRYADTRIRELKPRIRIDRANNTIEARENVRPLLFLSGGVIPDRGYFNMRESGSNAKIGELDEEFVWERSLGDAFPFGNQIWQIQRVTHNDVFVKHVSRSNSLIPFWKAEDMNRSFYLSQRIAEFLEEANTAEDEPFRSDLAAKHGMTEPAANIVMDFIDTQKKATGVLPGRHTLLVEHYRDATNASDAKQTVLHTLWGGRVNRPFAFALSAAWEEKYGYPLEIFANNDCILLNLPHDFGADDILELVDEDGIPRLLRSKLESTGFFGARFRENAQRSLLITRRHFHDRMPLWLNRLRSKKLLDAVARFEDFPVVLETWRTCMNDEFDLGALSQMLGEIRDGTIHIVETVSETPSPFAESVIWRQTNQYMYQDDTPGSKLRTSLSDDIIEEMIDTPHLRPRFSDELIASFQRKLHRTAPGYAPQTAEELYDWIEERMFIPVDEWRELCTTIDGGGGTPSEELVRGIDNRLVHLKFIDGERGVTTDSLVDMVTAVMDTVPAELAAYRETDTDNGGPPAIRFMREWLKSYGPILPRDIAEKFGMPVPVIESVCEVLIEERSIVRGPFREWDESPSAEICESGNFETLVRLRRSLERPSFEPLGIEKLPLFLAAYQGICPPGDGIEDLENSLERLFGLPLRAALWETDVLPARLNPYYTAWLDTTLHRSELVWYGCGKERTGFCFESDYDLFSCGGQEGNVNGHENNVAAEIDEIFDRVVGRLSLTDIMNTSRSSIEDITGSLWNNTWGGRLSNDDYETLRKGIMNGFMPEKPAEKRGRRRYGFNRWKSSRPFSGQWFRLLDSSETEADPLDAIERDKDRIRQLFMRYGILFRELLRNEIPAMQWGRMFRTLRLMELSGEITAGWFFRDIPGPQFCSPAALRFLAKPLPEDTVYWMNATDPASLCGAGIETLGGNLPSRIPSTHLVYRGSELVLISKRTGKELEFMVPPDHPGIGDFLGFFTVLLTRAFQPVKRITVETINGEKALDSPYLPALKAFGFTRDYNGIVLVRSY